MAFELRLLDPRGFTQSEEKVAPGAEEAEEQEKRLFCARCRHPVTHQDERIEVNGAHQHRCTNPAGYIFNIGCFREAGGCIAAGEATAAHTWFKGYAWRISMCASCECHLGWRFEATADHFYGLILDHLTSAGGARRARGCP